jgi:phosphoribosylanthranilate isomerase
LPKIKICGLFRSKDIDYINTQRPDYIGFVFAPSRRQVDEKTAYKLRKKLISGIVPVGVFVNGGIEQISKLYKQGVIEYAQLHGNENADYIARLKSACPQIKLIKAVVVKSGENIERAQALDVEYLLLDSGKGSGKAFDWNVLAPLASGSRGSRISDTHKPYFLAGGIHLENISRALALNPYGVDVSSGAETDGVKDGKKIAQLVRIAHEHGGKPT